MVRVMFFIDGFNVYHSLKNHYRKYLWLNYKAFAHRFITKKQILSGVFYFTAKALWLPDSVKRHEMLISALENVEVKTVLGRYKKKDRWCGADCKKHYTSHEEKRTDVNIALYLYHQAHLNSYDRGVLVSADTDLIPAIRMVKEVFPKKEIVVLFPIGRSSAELRQVADFIWKTREKQLNSSQFPDEIILPNGKVLRRPKSWK